MRISAIHGEDIPPVQYIDIAGLSDIVVLAGPNGVGKTRFIEWLQAMFQGAQPDLKKWILIDATSEDEIKFWGKKTLDTRVTDDANKLREYLRRRKARAKQIGSVLNFDSNRAITTIQPYNYSWDYSDPFAEEVNWNFGFQTLSSRFSDTIHSIFRKVRSRREAIALAYEKLLRSAKEVNGTVGLDPKDFPDPLEPFYRAFTQLLAPKRLVEPEAAKQQLFFADALNNELPISSLSSGEREVVNVVFDFLLRSPTDCIVFFDEPELHLHPELSYKLLQALRTSGLRNQFIFCTHSAEIITASLDYSVIFISPAKGPGINQAVVVREDDDTHQALKLLGQSIGIVALGKKIVLIEGDHSSLDKQTYGAILKGNFPTLVLVPSGGKGLIQSFDTILERVVERSVWGIKFFMLCDLDAVPSESHASQIESKATGRVKFLRRYHLENYFLDSRVIVKIFEALEPPDHWLRDPKKIHKKLVEIASTRLSHATALIVSAHFREVAGSVTIMPKDCHDKSVDELVAQISFQVANEVSRISTSLDLKAIEDVTRKTYERLRKSLVDGTWITVMPARPILNIFCSTSVAGLDFGRFKIAYLALAGTVSPSPFEEVEEIFRSFAAD
jgi:predicted ATPase